MRPPQTFPDVVTAIAELYGANFIMIFRKEDGKACMLTTEENEDAIDTLQRITQELIEDEEGGAK